MDELAFHYIKSPSHQEIKVDGAFGGPGPFGGNIAVSVYTERNPIPTVVYHQVTDLGEGKVELGGEILDKREGRQGIVRVVQCTLHMNLAQAKILNEWLAKHISDVEKQGGSGS